MATLDELREFFLVADTADREAVWYLLECYLHDDKKISHQALVDIEEQLNEYLS